MPITKVAKSKPKSRAMPPAKELMPTGRERKEILLVRTKTNTNSFQFPKKEKTNMVETIGRETGMMMR